MRRTQKRVLVRGGDDFKLGRAGVEPEPAPARALNTSRGGIHLRLEGYERAGFEVPLHRTSVHLEQSDEYIAHPQPTRNHALGPA